MSFSKKNIRGNYTVSPENYKHLTILAKQTYWSTSKAEELQRERSNSGREYWALEEKIESLKQELAELKETCKPYLEALKIAPKAVKRFIDNILERFRKQQKDIFYKSGPQQTLKQEEHNKHEKVIALRWLMNPLIYAKRTTTPTHAGAVFSSCQEYLPFIHLLF